MCLSYALYVKFHHTLQNTVLRKLCCLLSIHIGVAHFRILNSNPDFAEGFVVRKTVLLDDREALERATVAPGANLPAYEPWCYVVEFTKPR